MEYAADEDATWSIAGLQVYGRLHEVCILGYRPSG
jgi:hypothetical protein